MSWGQLRHNACPRCRGTMSQDRDRFGAFLECLQCGNVIDLDPLPFATKPELVAKLVKRTGTKLPKPDRETVGTH